MFTFKQFTVHQDRCAMKVGTDGVLLGAWAPLDHHPFSILDIGTGTGLIALMLAQRSDAEQVDALEIDPDAFEQAADNFEASPWADRLFCFHAGLDEFVDEPEDTYDLILSNPPFHEEQTLSPDEARSQARFSGSLPLEELFEAATLLLSDDGVLAIIIPYKSEPLAAELAAASGLYPFRITRVKGTPDAAVKRSLMAFSRQQSQCEESDLTLELARHQYTDAFRDLVRDFYLKL